MTVAREGLPLVSRRSRITIRTRLTLTYAGLVTGCGAVLIAVVWVFMRFVPYYAIMSSTPTGLATGHATSAPATNGDAEKLASSAPFAATLAVTSAWDFLQLLLIISVAALTVLAVLSGFIGWIVAGRVLKPLKTINEAATIAATGSFDHRVGLQGPRDEIRDLSDTFDGMLGELGRSFDAYRRFAGNASHELRTPIATTQTMIDVALADPDAGVEDLRALLGRIRNVNHANAETVESLLDLADIGSRRLSTSPVDLQSLAEEVVRDALPLAREGGVSLALRPRDSTAARPIVSGDLVLLRQCLSNLVQNAVRHNHRGGSALIAVSSTSDGVEVSVTNSGPPIADDVVETLLEPFVRGAGRTSGTGAGRGRGLGLAIASSVADAHDGSLELVANPDGGLQVRLQLPSSPTPSAEGHVSAPKNAK
ncbi:sensor histidine kinase [Leifsonia sp. McL0607]|uniref:sensor histidine kinase n=1 Tax=Leifsonia sp. McL0607 TaxID=3415672 RepID=UPI003CF3528E